MQYSHDGCDKNGSVELHDEDEVYVIVDVVICYVR